MNSTTHKSSRPPAAQRKEQIILAATELFADRGFEGMTMGMLAAACGITEPALYRHFHSKEDLYAAVINSLRLRLDLGGALARIGESDDLGTILTSLAHFVLANYGKHPEFGRILLQCSLQKHHLCGKAFADLREPFVLFLRDKLADLIRSGAVRKVHPEITARCFIGMVMDCSLAGQLWKGIQGRAYDSQKVVRNNISIYVRGLAPEGAVIAAPRPRRPRAVDLSRGRTASQSRGAVEEGKGNDVSNR